MQLRTIIAATAIGLSIACIAGLASAQQIYTWKDSGGVTHFSQSPPANGVHYTKMRLAGEPDVSSNPPAAANNAPEASTKDQGTAARAANTTQADTPSNRAELCKQLSSNVALLQGKQPVVTGGGGGKQQVMSDDSREKALATAQSQQAQYCSAH